MPGSLAAGERVLLIDAKDRRYLITLVPGAMFHTHAGIVAHDDLIGSCEGRTITGSTGPVLPRVAPDAQRRRAQDARRGAQVIYPKDLGAILIAADIGPGQRVLEAGVGSGALSMTVLRAGACVVGYELREDFAARAKANVEAALGPDAPYRVEIRDVTQGIDERDLDRVLLDMPVPHKVVAAAARRCAWAASCWPICRRSIRPRCSVPPSTIPSRPSGWPRRRRSSGARGTWRPARCAPITAWSGTRDS